MSDTAPPDTHARIQLAARKLFLRDGFIKTDVSKIVKEAHTSKREFYKHYETREDAFLEAVKNVLQEGRVVSTISDFPPREILPRLARSFYKSNTNAESNGLFRASIVASIKSPELDAIVYQARAEATLPLVQRLSEWREAGLVTFRDPLLTMLRFGFLATDGLNHIMGDKTYNDDELDKHADAVIDLFLNGCASHEVRTTPDAKLTSIAPLLPAPPEIFSNDEKPSRLSIKQWDAIYDAAWKEFRDNGFSMSSMEAIARACGTPRSTIYRRHPTKIDLFSATAIKITENIFPKKIEISSTPCTAEDALKILAQHIITAFTHSDNIRIHKILISEAGQIPNTTKNIYKIIKKRFIHIIKQFFSNNISIFNFTEEKLNYYSWLFMISTTLGARLLFMPPQNLREIEILSEDSTQLFLFGVRHKE